MFGTNWPQLRHDRALAQLDGLGLTDEAREEFLGGAAARVFKLPRRPGCPLEVPAQSPAQRYWLRSG